ncbi:restriction endonuclease, partial [Butyricicoccus sp. 1XD8-22]
LYQITLRTIHELYEADDINSIDSVVFNGWVKSIDKGTGKEITACILSIQTVKSEFEEINLALVDPKICFKNLKGVGSSKLHSLAPIAPIIKINREDERFVSSYDVADTLEE